MRIACKKALCGLLLLSLLTSSSTLDFGHSPSKNKSSASEVFTETALSPEVVHVHNELLPTLVDPRHAEAELALARPAARLFGGGLSAHHEEFNLLPTLINLFSTASTAYGQWLILPLTKGAVYDRLILPGELVTIFLVRGLWERLNLRKTPEQMMPWDFVSYPLRTDSPDSKLSSWRRGIYLDYTTAQVLSKLSEEFRRGWITHELAYFRHPDLTHDQIVALYPMPPLSPDDQLVAALAYIRAERFDVGLQLLAHLLLREDLSDHAAWVQRRLNRKAVERMAIFNRMISNDEIEVDDIEALEHFAVTLASRSDRPVALAALHVIADQWSNLEETKLSGSGSGGRDHLIQQLNEEIIKRQDHLDDPASGPVLGITLASLIKLNRETDAGVQSPVFSALASRLANQTQDSPAWGSWIRNLFTSINLKSAIVQADGGQAVLDRMASMVGQPGIPTLLCQCLLGTYAPIEWKAQIASLLADDFRTPERQDALKSFLVAVHNDSKRADIEASKLMTVEKYLKRRQQESGNGNDLLLIAMQVVEHSASTKIVQLFWNQVSAQNWSLNDQELWVQMGLLIAQRGTPKQAQAYLNALQFLGDEEEFRVLGLPLARQPKKTPFTKAAMVLVGRLDQVLANHPEWTLDSALLSKLAEKIHSPELIRRLTVAYVDPDNEDSYSWSLQSEADAIVAYAPKALVFSVIDQLIASAPSKRWRNFYDAFGRTGRGGLMDDYRLSHPWTIGVFSHRAKPTLTEQEGVYEDRRETVVSRWTRHFGFPWIETHWAELSPKLDRLVRLDRWAPYDLSSFLLSDHWMALADKNATEILLHIELYVSLAEWEDQAMSSSRLSVTLLSDIMNEIRSGDRVGPSSEEQLRKIKEDIDHWWNHKIWIENTVPERLESLFKHYGNALGIDVSDIRGLVSEERGIASVRYKRFVGAMLSMGQHLTLTLTLQLTLKHVFEFDGWVKVDKTLLEKYRDVFVPAMAFMIPHEFAHILENRETEKATWVLPKLDLYLSPVFPAEDVAQYARELAMDRMALELILRLGTYTEGFDKETPLKDRAALGLAATISLVFAPERQSTIKEQWQKNPAGLLAGLARFNGEILALATDQTLKASTLEILAARAAEINKKVQALNFRPGPQGAFPYPEYTRLVMAYQQYYSQIKIKLKPSTRRTYIMPNTPPTASRLNRDA